jgi:hypothetical protein
MRWIYSFSFFVLISCVQEPNNIVHKESLDTVLTKHKDQYGLFSKSYSYQWHAGKDTLDLFIHVFEYDADSSVHVNAYHKKPIVF